mgnify:CR=1 FL=1
MEFKGEEQRDAGDRNRDAKHDNRPENQLLTCVEFACWGMNAFGKQATTNSEPFQIVLVGNVVSNPEDRDQSKTKHESPRQVIVRPFACDDHWGVGFVTNKRDNGDAAKKQGETRNPQDNE